MKAMFIYKYGSPESFELEEFSVPEIKDDELLVKSYGSSVNPLDCAIRQGKLKSFLKILLPAVLGVDISGIVEKVGKNVTRFAVGDRVYAFLGLNTIGAYAEFVAIPESHAAAIPSNLNIAHAGVVPCVGLTAYQSLTEYASVKQGMKVLIVGSGGGVGTFAIQIAKALGAQVTALCSESKAEISKRLGAERVINYHRENIFHLGKKYDVILNCIRGSKTGQWKKLLTKDGKHILISAETSQIPFIRLSNIFSSKKSILFHVKADGNALQVISELIEAKKIKPIISKTFEFEALTRAHRFFESESVVGKISIAMNGNSLIKYEN